MSIGQACFWGVVALMGLLFVLARVYEAYWLQARDEA